MQKVLSVLWVELEAWGQAKLTTKRLVENTICPCSSCSCTSCPIQALVRFGLDSESPDGATSLDIVATGALFLGRTRGLRTGTLQMVGCSNRGRGSLPATVNNPAIFLILLASDFCAMIGTPLTSLVSSIMFMECVNTILLNFETKYLSCAYARDGSQTKLEALTTAHDHEADVGLRFNGTVFVNQNSWLQQGMDRSWRPFLAAGLHEPGGNQSLDLIETKSHLVFCRILTGPAGLFLLVVQPVPDGKYEDLT